MMNIDEVSMKLPQRPPFQMVDRVIELVPGESSRGRKCVSVNEPYFTGHFPGAPIMPGVLLIESCAQLCSMVMDGPKEKDTLYVLLKVDGFKFLKPVIPGDVMDITVRKVREGGGLFTFEAAVWVGETLHAKGSLTFTSMDRSRIFARRQV